VWFGCDTSRLVILSGSDVGGRSAGSCCFEHGEWYLYRLDIKAGMFRNGHESDGIFANDHLLALYRGDLARRHLEGLRNANYFRDMTFSGM